MDAVQGTALAVVWALIVGAFVWLNVVTIRRRRRYYKDHPERRLYGWKLLLRGSPFIAIVVVSAIYGIVAGEAMYAVYGIVGTAAFAWVISRQWRPPAS